MLWSDRCDHTVIGMHHIADLLDIAHMAGTHLTDEISVVGFREPRMVRTTPIGVLKLSGVTSTLYFSCNNVCK